jgi:rhamnulose-1-phosphate aldolase
MLEEIMRHIGLAGSRLDSIGASEGAAGNISVYLGWDVELRHNFPDVVEYKLPVAATELAGGTFLVTGSGCRLGEIGRDPEGNLCAIRINPGGETALLHTSRRK